MSAFDFTCNEDTSIFIFKGELDTLACMGFEEEVLTLVKTHKGKVAFDLQSVNYISSSFIRLCGSAATLVGSQNISLINLNKEIKKNLTKIGLASVLNIK
ncbi:MAG TPA: hypothetical protein DD381_01940 [Lentisphaeria bacterium]|nr:MAG: hypothetical protein A2X47_12650 [Lentisphaerae bacterium GWF2_38_69]HBM15101.1 hypothetical protein [Lentisphaeria bacterium]